MFRNTSPTYIALSQPRGRELRLVLTSQYHQQYTAKRNPINTLKRSELLKARAVVNMRNHTLVMATSNAITRDNLAKKANDIILARLSDDFALSLSLLSY